MSFSDCFSQHFSLNALWGPVPFTPNGTLPRLMIGLGAYAFFLAVGLTPLGQLMYSRALRRLVRLHQIADAPATLWTRRGSRLRAPLAAQRLDSMPLVEASRARERRLRWATWISYGVFVAYGFGALQATKTDRGFEDSLVVLGYLVGMAFGPAAVNVVPYGSKRALMLVPLLIVAAWGFVEPLSAGTAALAVVLMLSLYLMTVHRTMRAVLLPLTVLLVAVAIALSVGLQLFMTDALQCQFAVKGSADSQAYLGFLVSTAAVCVVIGLSVGVVVLQFLVRIIERGWLSDISLVAMCGVIVLGGFLTVGVETRITSSTAALLFGGWVVLTLVAYVITLRVMSCPADSCTLLILRVFSRDSRAERLLDGLQSRWRLVGPVLEMGGPDLVRLNLELRGFSKFLGLALHEILHPRGATEAAFRSSLDLAIDREGRFRLNELFSFNSSWQSVLERLLLLSDVVLLDLRGFKTERAGTAYEIQRLCELGRMGRVLAVHDAQTDWTHFNTVLRRAGGVDSIPVRVDTSSDDAASRCLEGLLELAEQARDRSITSIGGAGSEKTGPTER